MDDDEIVDAEIMDDDFLPALREQVALATLANSIDVGEPLWMPPGAVLVVLDYEQRQLIRAALAHYHDKGPRDRNTRDILDTLTHIANCEPEQKCSDCDNTGKYRTMYEMSFCHCPKGVERRHNESK